MGQRRIHTGHSREGLKEEVHSQGRLPVVIVAVDNLVVGRIQENIPDIYV